MNKDNLVATIGNIIIQLDTSPDKTTLILSDNAQAQRLAALISLNPDRPLDIDWQDAESPDSTIIRMEITPAEDRRIADIINGLLALYYAIPDHARNEEHRP